MGAAYDRALILYQQHRIDLAVSELARELQSNPRSGEAHALLALCEVERKRFPLARSLAEYAIGLSPELAFAHYALAWVFYRDSAYVSRRGMVFGIDQADLRRQCLRLAEAPLAEALRLAPQVVAHHALWGFILLERGDVHNALTVARFGLSLDPNHLDCRRLLALSLRELGNVESASVASAQAVAIDPEDATAHLTRAWTLLRARQVNEAIEHFREAIRLNPNSEAARTGLLEGLRSRHALYRVITRATLLLRQARKSGIPAFLLGYIVAYGTLLIAVPLRYSR